MPDITVEPDYVTEDFEAAIEEVIAEGKLVTSRRVADHVGCSRERARQYLVEQHDQDNLDRDRVGGGAVVYLPPSRELDNVHQYRSASAQTDVAPAQSQGGSGEVAPAQDGDAPAQSDAERVMFFPSRREIVVDDPTPETRATLSKTSHVIDSTGDGYLYKISEADVWNAPYDEFDALRADLRSVVGEDQWDAGFESRLQDDWDRAHQFRLRTGEDSLTWLHAEDRDAFQDVKRRLEHNTHYTRVDGDDLRLRLKRGSEGSVKEHLYDEGYPPIDERRLEEGADLDVQLVDDIDLRDYQQDWVDHFAARKAGVFVGPSGAGKTIAAIGAMEAIGGETLILVPNRELANQWEDEILETTNLRRGKIGQYHGGEKRIRPVTIATYDTAAMSRHRELFNEREWGLVIADECHHAVADTWKRFRSIQSTARLGLSATPVRESGDAKEIYTLIGPPVGSDWGALFADGWVERPNVEIVTVPWGSDDERDAYERASGSKQLIEAARNSAKTDVVDELLERHDAKTIIFVDWIKQGKQLADTLDLPFIYGETSHDRRDELYQQFRDGALEALIISRVGDEGIDLPDAEVAILASTMGSSRSQTGQRAGRTMRPMGDSQVYVLLTKGSGEEDWGRESTQYLAEKGIDITKTEWDKND
ncbi:DEAD/DEAH box helicase [Halomicroarcula sp. S1AR25-4]|uniref:DEAD/DEAH box helicase n=1 Tax=Haloarcula sp. S1AR25-4 TaxID=2950538 RepID=UPI0028754A63|nr:DEAD/DEAH box helicase [Halomicroarcula sp. S1AR25-4]MDS0280318.1 DEAD/DEAH box helicase [Halomicroarcula sp. S1AR25-4]